MCDFKRQIEAQPPPRTARVLTLILGDQLDPNASVLTVFNRDNDACLMIEAKNEAEHVSSHRQR